MENINNEKQELNLLCAKIGAFFSNCDGNFSEEENLAREKRVKYMETKQGELMLSLGKPEDFPFEELTDDERVHYFDNYMKILNEFVENSTEEE